MKKLTTILLCLFATMFLCFAQNVTKKMAVATFDIASNAVSKEDAEAITELYINELVNTGKVTVVDRANFDKLLKEMKFQASDWSDKEKTSKLGQAANAEVIARGQILKLGSKFYLSATAVDVKTAVILSSSRKPFNSVDDIFNLLAPLAEEVVKGVSKKNMSYSVGDTGPGGGIIFYVSEEGFDVFDGKGGVKNCHYLEMTEFPIGNAYWAPKGQEFKLGAYNQKYLGYGKSNTYGIVELYKNVAPTPENCAAYACYTYKNDKTEAGEWFLPSEDELEVLEKNLPQRLRVADKGMEYWQSSDLNLYYASVDGLSQKYYSLNLIKETSDVYGTYDYWWGWMSPPDRHLIKYENTGRFLVRPIRAF